MKMKFRTVARQSLGVAVLLTATTAAAAEWRDFNRNGVKDAYEDPSVPNALRVENLLAQMTEAEKIGQLNQLVPAYYGQGGATNAALEARIRAGEASSFIYNGDEFGKEHVRTLNRWQKLAVEESRLGIPVLVGHDVIHGMDLTFPIAPALAGAFEPELFEKAQAVAAAEARACGVAWSFAPMCDIARDQRWGRVAETCGEDPYLAALCCAAQVRGFQGADPSAPDRVAACMKHFVGYSSSLGGRDYQDAQFSEWDLRNLHLQSFRAAKEAGILTVMSSFNTIDGIPAAQCHHTMSDILRGEWSFTGFVVSDWGGVGDALRWGMARDGAEAARRALNAGNDMDMFDDLYCEGLPKEIAAGRVTRETLDEAVRRVLRVKFALGLFERPYAEEGAYEKICDEKGEFRQAARKLAREAVAKSAVLMKNDGLLPLKTADLKRIALIGPMADNGVEMVGCWRGRGHKETVVTLKAALERALPGVTVDCVAGCSVDTAPATKTLQDGSIVLDPDAVPADGSIALDAAVAAARAADVVILAVGETCSKTGECASRAGLGLTGRQGDLVKAVNAVGKPTVAFVFSGRTLVVPEIWDGANAFFYAWQPGSEAGNGLVDLLLGKVSPSARLSMSVPADVGQTPCYYNHPTRGRPWQGNYMDIGNPVEVKARYPFGYGLTYGKFEYGPVTVKDGVASCALKNVGACAATEVAQLYVRATYCSEGWRPERELRGFERVMLGAGESKTVSFKLGFDQLCYTGRDGVRKTDENVKYLVRIASDSTQGEPAEFVR